jgi:hypothetical protein
LKTTLEFGGILGIVGKALTKFDYNKVDFIILRPKI